jgi:hypothetical protein
MQTGRSMKALFIAQWLTRNGFGVWLTIFSFRRSQLIHTEEVSFRRKLKIVSQTPAANRAELRAAL